MTNTSIPEKASRLPAMLAALQIVLTIVVYIGFSTIGGAVIGVGLPTRSCPNGASLTMTQALASQCRIERLGLYLPEWVVSVTQIAVILGVVTMTAGVANWLRHKGWSEKSPSDTALAIQAGAFFGMVVVHALIMYPWNVAEAARIVVYGVNYLYR